MLSSLQICRSIISHSCWEVKAICQYARSLNITQNAWTNNQVGRQVDKMQNTMIARRKTCKGWSLRNAKVFTHPVAGLFQVAPGDSCGFFGLRAAKDTSPSNLFSQSCNDSVCFGAMVFFSPFLWISPSSSSKNLWRCSSQIWYCQSKILLNIKLASIWKSTSPPKDPNHSNSMPLQISQVWPDCSEFQIRAHRPAKQRPEKKTPEIGAKNQAPTTTWKFQSGRFCAGLSFSSARRPQSWLVLFLDVFGSMSIITN